MGDKHIAKKYRDEAIGYVIKWVFDDYDIDLVKEFYGNYVIDWDNKYRQCIYWELVDMEYSLGFRDD